MKNIFSKNNDRLQTILVIATVILIMTTFVLGGVFLASGHYWIKSFYLGDKGALGDAVNGLSAPFISFFSAVLIYITFREQVKANKLLQSQWQIDTFLKVFHDMTEKLKGLKGEFPSGIFDENNEMIFDEYRGLAVAEYINLVHDTGTEDSPLELTEFVYIIDELTFLCDLVIESPDNRKEFMRQKVVRFYYSGFHSAIYSLEQKLPEDRGAYRPFFRATEKLHDRIRLISTVGDLSSAHGEGREHQEFK
jgi:hypothetical protein